jgi:hypothetical protein
VRERKKVVSKPCRSHTYAMIAEIRRYGILPPKVVKAKTLEKRPYAPLIGLSYRW